MCSNVFALDNALRLMGSSIALFNTYAPQDAKLPPRLATLLAGKISDTRFVNRLTYGVPCSVADMRANWGLEKQSLDAWLGRLMALSMLAYYPLEHGWYLSTLKPLGEYLDGDKWSLWSCRFWLVYCVCDLIGLVKRLQGIKRGLDSSKSTPEEKQAFAKQKQDQQLAFSSAVADFVIALQYSSTTPVFANNTVTWAIWYGGAAGLYKRWLARS